MFLLGILLLGLGFVGATIALARATREVLEPVAPEQRTRRLLEALKVQFGKNYSYVYSILPYIQSAANKYRVDPALILAFMAQESKGNPKAISSVGAIGLMQIMPSTARRICGYSASDLYDPIKNIDCGTKLLAYLLSRVPTLRDVIAAYYAGEKAVTYRKKYGRYPAWGNPPVAEYVKSVYDRYIFLREAVA